MITRPLTPSPTFRRAIPFQATEGPLATSSCRYSRARSIRKMLQERQSRVMRKMETIDSRTEFVDKLLVIWVESVYRVETSAKRAAVCRCRRSLSMVTAAMPARAINRCRVVSSRGKPSTAIRPMGPRSAISGTLVICRAREPTSSRKSGSEAVSATSTISPVVSARRYVPSWRLTGRLLNLSTTSAPSPRSATMRSLSPSGGSMRMIEPSWLPFRANVSFRTISRIVSRSAA